MAKRNNSYMIVEDGITPMLDDIGDPLENAEESFEAYKDIVLEDAKENAPWQDRTGDARAGLDAEVTTEGNLVVLSLFHTVEYGIWLETAFSGDYAIIMPTLEKWGMEVFRDAGDRMTGVGVGGLL